MVDCANMIYKNALCAHTSNDIHDTQSLQILTTSQAWRTHSINYSFILKDKTTRLLLQICQKLHFLTKLKMNKTCYESFKFSITSSDCEKCLHSNSIWSSEHTWYLILSYNYELTLDQILPATKSNRDNVCISWGEPRSFSKTNLLIDSNPRPLPIELFKVM
jgi:hypothetical protein